MLALVPKLALAAYGIFGVFGHSLHGLLPCSDAACGSSQTAASEHCCCCDHDEPLITVTSGPATGGAEYRSAGHDADDCSLCTLLAKIKVGRLALFVVDFSIGHSHHESIAPSGLLPADLVLCAAPRGPPAC
jgi:hypothetical protein